ncbi:hypothetical protein, partial [Leptospira congkakensis]|uniref:hypothetical protein n=1 Tax=Leptospira congkakensis TaxID=2484932 RepID=UPI001ABF16E8
SLIYFASSVEEFWWDFQFHFTYTFLLVRHTATNSVLTLHFGTGPRSAYGKFPASLTPTAQAQGGKLR